MNTQEDYRAKRKNIVKVSVIGVLLLLGLVTLLTSMRSVDTGRIGVVTQMGAVTGRELKEGFAFVAPWGFNNVTEYDIKTQKNEIKAAAATKEQQDVTAKVVITYHLESGKVSEIHRTVGVGYEGVLIKPVAESTFKNNSAQFSAPELTSKRLDVEKAVKKALVEKVSSRGIVIEDVAITDMQFSKKYTQAIEDRQVAEQNAKRAEYNLQQARFDAQSQEVQAKTLTPEYLQLKAIERWDGKMPQAVGGSGLLFNIPR